MSEMSCAMVLIPMPCGCGALLPGGGADSVVMRDALGEARAATSTLSAPVERRPRIVGADTAEDSTGAVEEVDASVPDEEANAAARRGERSVLDESGSSDEIA